jgi:iron complex transport system substrate-binding protein
MSLRAVSLKLVVPLLFLAGLACSLPAEPGYPLTVQDASGYRLTLAAPPRAIVSLTLTTDEILSDLVDGSRFKAIDSFAADPGISNIVAFARTVPLKLSADKEKIIALRPDLVFLAEWKEKEFIQTLHEAKIPVFVIPTPDTFEKLKSVVAELAALVGEPARGKVLWASLDRRLNAVSTKLRSVPAGRRLTVLSYSFSGSTYARGTSFDELSSKAGLINVASRAGLSGWPQLSKEKVLELDPDVITLPSWSYDGKTDPSQFRDALMNDPVFSSLKAVKTKKIFVMQDNHLQATSQYMVDAVEDLARAAYPELFP